MIRTTQGTVIVIVGFLIARLGAFGVQRPTTWQRQQSQLRLRQDKTTSSHTAHHNDPTNWLEKSCDNVDDDKEYYNLGLSGGTWKVGALSLRMFDAMQKANKLASKEADDAQQQQQQLLLYKQIAMESAAQQAVRAALKQNGLELLLQTDDDNDESWWSQVDYSIHCQLLSSSGADDSCFDNWQDAVAHGWTPGQDFDLVVRHVPARARDLSVEELLQALDPEGSLRQEALQAGITLPDDTTDECESLADMAAENVRRTEQTPAEAVAEADANVGGNTRGYRILNAQDLWSLSLIDNHQHQLLEFPTVLHVMDALVSHGCLVVDVTNGGQDLQAAQQLADMWKTTHDFFAASSSSNVLLPPLATASDTGSPHAKVGYADYDDGNLQFLETRLSRTTERHVLPLQLSTSSYLSAEACDALRNAFDLLASLGKRVVRIAVAASTLEAAATAPSSAVPPDFDAWEAANRVAEEILDDGQPLKSKVSSSDDEALVHTEGSVSMSPHRLCRYSNENKKGAAATPDVATREVFGAHTDSSFVTIVPVAAVSGLEVYDEAAETWYRPELAAKRHFYAQQQTASGDMASLPWHARYVVILPGELLQILTRQEILAAVHRVVATQHHQSRYSAPILLRGRSGTILDAGRYWGIASTPLQKECDGKSMEQIHDAMQPKPVQQQ